MAMEKVSCNLRPVVGGPMLIYGYVDREHTSPDMVYMLNDQGFIMRGNQQRPMSVKQVVAMDADAERCAEGYREEHKLALLVA